MKSSNEEAPDRLQVRIRLHNKPRLTLVARYLEENDYDITQEVIKLLEARFLPEAIQQYEGKVKKNIVFECLGTLEGFMRSIENSCGVTPTRLDRSQRIKESGEPDDLEDSEEALPPDPIQEQHDLSKRLFGAEAFSG